MSTFLEKLELFTAKRHTSGCSIDEIESLVRQGNVELPVSYRQFMLVAGRGVDDFLQGSDFTFDELDDMREAADELLVESGLNRLTSDSFVFAMHQGYQFYFFQNGKVYYYLEGEDHIERRFASFEEFFDSEISDIEKYKNK